MSKSGIWRRLAYALGLAALLLVSRASAPPALAHASLVGAQPGDGNLLPESPATLKLDFNEPVLPLIVRLVGPNGAVVTPKVKAENNTLTITPPALGRGTHVLSYRVTSADGHPIGGALTFSVGAESATPEAGAVETDPAVGAAIWSARILIYLGLFVGVGGAAFIALLARARPLPGRAERWIAAAMIAGLLATAISVGLQGLDALAQPLGQLVEPDIWQSGAATSYGWSAAAAALAQLLGLAALALRSRVGARLCATAALACVGLVVSTSGHAATVEPQIWSRAAVFLHAVSIAFWVGSLVPLMVIVRDRSRGNGELTAFSRSIPVPLAVLIATGTYLAYIELDRPDALWTTSYGEVLSGKLALVLVLLAFAAANRYFLVPRLYARASAAPRRLARAIAAIHARARDPLHRGDLALHAAAARADRGRGHDDPFPRPQGDGGDRPRAGARARRRGRDRGPRRQAPSARRQGGDHLPLQSGRRDREHAPRCRKPRHPALAHRRPAHSGRGPLEDEGRHPGR